LTVYSTVNAPDVPADTDDWGVAGWIRDGVRVDQRDLALRVDFADDRADFRRVEAS
jgi:hypothetical protein